MQHTKWGIIQMGTGRGSPDGSLQCFLVPDEMGWRKQKKTQHTVKLKGTCQKTTNKSTKLQQNNQKIHTKKDQVDGVVFGSEGKNLNTLTFCSPTRWVARTRIITICHNTALPQKKRRKISNKRAELSTAVTYMFGDVAAPGVHIVPVSRQERATSLISVLQKTVGIW